MPEFVLKYADTRGEIHSQVVTAGSGEELRDKYAGQGYLVYSVKPRGGASALSFGGKKSSILRSS